MLPKKFRKKQRLKASDLNSMLVEIEAARNLVSDGSISIERSPGGSVLRIVRKLVGGCQWFLDDSGETCPPFGLFQDTDVETWAGDNPVMKGKKPFEDGGVYFVNHDHSVPHQSSGYSWQDGVFPLLYEGGLPEFGQTFGAKVGQWEASPDEFGFVCLGILDESAQVMLAMRHLASMRFRAQLESILECDDDVAMVSEEPIYPLDGGGSITFAEPFEASNAMGFVGDAGDAVIVCRQDVPGEPPWLVEQIKHKCFYGDTDQRVNGFDFQHKKQRGSIPGHDEEDFETWATGDDCP